MRYLVLDLETILDPSVPFEPKTPDEFPPACCWQIVTIGYYTIGFPVERMGVISGDDERTKLAKLISVLEKEKPTLITWNGRGFDLPVIVMRALKYGLQMPWWFHDRSTRYRYSPDGHCDLKDFLADFGACKSGSLDQVAKLIGFPGKVGVDGSQVAAMFAAGKQREIDDYCVCDVVQTAAVFMRVQVLRGEAAIGEFRDIGEALRHRLFASGAAVPVLERVKWGEFLLEEERKQ
jgi:predicted PolB exonuclease-like 3'-5' exonuclease